MSEQLIQIENVTYSIEQALANPQEFLTAIKPRVSEKIFGKEGEPPEKQVKRLFSYASHRKGFAVKTDVSETPTEQPSEIVAAAPSVEPKVTVYQTPSALAMNSKDLAIDVLVRISDLLLRHVYTDESQTFPNDLMQALRDLNDSAKAVKAIADSM